MLSQKPPLSSSSPGAHVGPQLLILLLTGLLVPPAVRASDDFKYRATKAADASGAAAHKAGPSQIAPVPLTLLPDNPFGAKCLDGSPPGYYLRPARASQSRFWHIHLPGGGWCTTEDSCAYRAGRRLGSSHLWAPEINPMWLPGILSANPNVNPGFGEWNMAMAVYCDGGGYVGRRGEVAVAGNRTLFMDGWKIVMAILDDLSSRGLMAAQQVLVTGESAGGQAVVNLCDYIAAYLSFATVKCLADGAFFIDAPDRRGRSFFREIAENATQLHQMFNPKCNQALPAEAQWRCFFPQYSLAYVTSDIFILNTILDPIALMIGNQLPFDKTHATQCLFDIRWGAGGGAGLWGREGGSAKTPRQKMLGGDGGAVFTSVELGGSDYNEAFLGSGYSEAGLVGADIGIQDSSSSSSPHVPPGASHRDEMRGRGSTRTTSSVSRGSASATSTRIASRKSVSSFGVGQSKNGYNSNKRQKQVRNQMQQPLQQKQQGEEQQLQQQQQACSPKERTAVLNHGSIVTTSLQKYASDSAGNIRVFLLNVYAHGIGCTSYWASFTSDWMLMPLNVAVANWFDGS
ncbi:hypothetical protein CLOM_g14508 [Closterium sp. NIES-68]|nr:hypothetical protein CLOM_g14508 [Closterium sp. NIES-68]